MFPPSITFNGHYLGDQGLVIVSKDLPFVQTASSIQLQDKTYAFESLRPSRDIAFDIAVIGKAPLPPLPVGDAQALKIQMDVIRSILRERYDCQLILDYLSDRYWLARFNALSGRLLSPSVYKGTLVFTCYDPLAYDINEVSHSFFINSDPKTIGETAGGTETIRPVYTLTAGEDLVGATIKVKNVTTDEELTWEGDIDNGEELEIDAEHWVVKLEGIESMLDVSGQFPTLLPGQLNSIKVTGFGLLGTLEIQYRNRYV